MKIKVRKTIKEEVERLERAYIIAHKTSIKLRNYFLERGIPEDILSDELESLRCGDITSDDFIKEIQEVSKEIKDKEKKTKKESK